MRIWSLAAMVLLGAGALSPVYAQDRFGGGVDPREVKYKQLDISHLAAPIMAPVPQSQTGIKGWFSRLSFPTWLGGKKPINVNPVAPGTAFPKQHAKNPYQPLQPIMSQ
jgi:hypothetical protein